MVTTSVDEMTDTDISVVPEIDVSVILPVHNEEDNIEP